MSNINKILLGPIAVFMMVLIPFVLLYSLPAHAAGMQTKNFAANPLATPAPVESVQECTPSKTDPNSCLKDNGIYLWLEYFINLFVIIVVVGSAVMIAYAGVEYVTSAGNPERVKSSRDKIRSVIIGMLTLVFLSAFLEWLIPGGVFG